MSIGTAGQARRGMDGRGEAWLGMAGMEKWSVE
jgi:hypothetical protein